MYHMHRWMHGKQQHRQRVVEMTHNVMMQQKDVMSAYVWDPCLSVAELTQLEHAIHAMLTPSFHRIDRTTLTSSPLGDHVHVTLQQHNLTQLIMMQVLRCDGDVKRAIERVHARTFEVSRHTQQQCITFV